MPRKFDVDRFRAVYEEKIVRGQFNEEPDYYPKWRSRYQDLLRRYCQHVDEAPARVLDIGGGQLGVLCRALWNDEVTVSDIGGSYLDYVRSQGVKTVCWNLCATDAPFHGEFDVLFFSEVIEHLPLPAHIVLERLRSALRPGGTLICTTPNLYRLRNIVYMALGKRIFDNFRMPTDVGLGHVIEYSPDHLRWQMERAGFHDLHLDLCQYHHSPNHPLFRVMSWVGYPLFLVPRFRDFLVVEAAA